MSAAGTETDSEDLRGRVLRGGRSLLVRQIVGLVVSVGGILALTRLIGPSAYGVYASAFSVMFFAQSVGEFGLDVFLVRFPGELSKSVCDQVFTLLLVLGTATTCLMLAATPAVAHIIDLPSFAPVAAVMFASILAVHLQQVPLSRLERNLHYGAIGLVEVSAQVAFFAVAIPCAVGGLGVWAPVCGWWTQQLLLLAGLFWADTYRPRLGWDVSVVRAAFSFGSLTTLSGIANNARTVAAPLIVGHALGAAAVGYVNLAIRITEQLGFARQVVTRLAFAVLAKLVDDLTRLRRAMERAMEAQLLAVGLPICGFAVVSGWLVPIVFGSEWTTVATLLPVLAPAYLALAVFSLHNVVIMTAARPWELIISQGSSTALLYASAWLLVPRYGLIGYAYAELVAMASWLLTDRLLTRRFLRPSYLTVGIWWGAFSATSLAPVTTWWLALSLAALLLPPSRRDLWSLGQMARERSMGPAVLGSRP